MRLPLFISIGVWASLSLAHASSPEEWTQISDENGIRIWQKKVEGTPFVAFRGRMVMNASLKKLLAVLHDQERKLEWMHDCVANEVLERKGLGNAIIYNRTAVRVILVSDRDIVVETKLTVLQDQGVVRIDAWSVEHPAMPKVDGVVRMPKLDLMWSFRVVNKNLTEVTYEVQTDPGGWLPAWLVNRVARKIPFHSLHKLDLQVKKPYPKAMAIIESKIDWPALGL